MQILVVVALFGLAVANNIVSPGSQKCLDIKCMCKVCNESAPLDDKENGCDRAGCDREEPVNITKGAGLHMWTCHDDSNQNFEIIGGRVMNKAAGRSGEGDAELCIDIKAWCQSVDDPAPEDPENGCETNATDPKKECCDPTADLNDPIKGCNRGGCIRQTLDQIKARAENGRDVQIQLYTCRDDTSTSTSFGTQKWDLLGNGFWKNEGTGLCLVAHPDEVESGFRGTMGALVHAHKCPDDVVKKADTDFVFDFETGDLAEDTNAAGDRLRLFSDGAVATPKRGSQVSVAAAAACALGLMAAVAAFIRSRRSPDHHLPLPDTA